MALSITKSISGLRIRKQFSNLALCAFRKLNPGDPGRYRPFTERGLDQFGVHSLRLGFYAYFRPAGRHLWTAMVRNWSQFTQLPRLHHCSNGKKRRHHCWWDGSYWSRFRCSTELSDGHK